MKKYLVALQTGGLMESPNIEYSDYQEIEANSPLEAEKEYNRINKCSYFYGKCMGEVKDGCVNIPVKDYK